MWLVHVKNDVCFEFASDCDIAANVFVGLTPPS